MQKYVSGFIFTPDLKQVLLIKKNRPDYMVGKCTGVGGKVENGETALQAMVREFKEEAGVYNDKWKEFCHITGEDHDVHYFYAIDEIFDVKQVEDEELVVCNIEYLLAYDDYCNTMSNVKWLINMGLSIIKGQERHSHFEITV